MISEQVEQTEVALGNLSALFASQDFKKLQPNVPLLSSLMGLLSNLIDASHIVPSGVDFVEQTVLSALTVIVSKVTVSTVTPGFVLTCSGRS